MTDTATEELIGEAAEADYHTVLEMWREVLMPSRTLKEEPITPQWASRVVTAFPGIAYQDMPLYRDYYFEKVDELLRILEAEIDEDDECLNPTSAEEDVAQNYIRYTNVLINWQKQVLAWELGWTPTSKDAAVDLASTAEVHKMFFAEQGLTALLDQIQFKFTDDLRDLLTTELDSLREEWKAAHE